MLPIVNIRLVPSAAPRNLTAWNESSTSMFLQWKPVAYEYADGVILGYRVYWHSAHDDWQSLQVNGGEITSVVIDHLRMYMDYEFRISAFTSVGEGDKSPYVEARTDQDGRLHNPNRNPNRNPNINLNRNRNPYRNRNRNRNRNRHPYRNPNCDPNINPNRNPYRNPNRSPNRNPNRNPNCNRNRNPNPDRNPNPNPNPTTFNHFID